MQWPAYFDHKNLDCTDIVHLPERYCAENGLSLGEHILVQTSFSPATGCVLTVGWDFLDAHPPLVWLASDRRQRIDQLACEVRGLDEDLVAEKLDMKTIQDRVDFILVEMKKKLSPETENIFRKRAADKIKRWAQGKRAVNYNLVYTNRNHFAFIFSSAAHWGILGETSLENVPVLFLASLERWKDRIDEYKQRQDGVLQTERKREQLLRRLRETSASLEGIFHQAQEAESAINVVLKRHQAMRFLQNVFGDFDSLKKGLATVVRQRLDCPKLSIAPAEIPSQPEITPNPKGLRIFPKKMKKSEKKFQVMAVSDAVEGFQKRWSEIQKDQEEGRKSPYLDKRIEALKAVDTSLKEILSESNAIDGGLSTLHSDVSGRYQQLQCALDETGQETRADFNRLARNIEGLLKWTEGRESWQDLIQKTQRQLDAVGNLLETDPVATGEETDLLNPANQPAKSLALLKKSIEQAGMARHPVAER